MIRRQGESMKEIIITKNHAQQRIDRFLKKYMPKASTGFLYKMLRKKRIKLNGTKADPDTILKVEDIIQMYLADETISKFQRQQEIVMTKGPIDIVYEDENILLVNKPKGLLVHGDRNENKNTLINIIYYYLNQQGSFTPTKENTFSPSCCNRIDRNTSGIVIVAKNYPTLQSVNSMIKEGRIIKKYLTLVKGKVDRKKELKGFLIKDLGKNKVKIHLKEKADAKFVHTKYRPVRYNKDFSLLEVNLITGRSHQIRAHLFSEGFPIIGDHKYGNDRVNQEFYRRFHLESQFLHSYFIQFVDCPEFLSYLEGKPFLADLPTELQKIVDSFSWEVDYGLLE